MKHLLKLEDWTTEEIIKQHNELKCGFYKKFRNGIVAN